MRKEGMILSKPSQQNNELNIPLTCLLVNNFTLSQEKAPLIILRKKPGSNASD